MPFSFARLRFRPYSAPGLPEYYAVCEILMGNLFSMRYFCQLREGIQLRIHPYYYHNSTRSWGSCDCGTCGRQLCFDGNKHFAGTDTRNKMAAEMVDLISAAESRSIATSLSQRSQQSRKRSNYSQRSVNITDLPRPKRRDRMRPCKLRNSFQNPK